MTFLRKEIIGDATLLLGDCRDILPTLAVDHVITDPPYSDNTHKQAKTNRGKGYGIKLVTFEALNDEAFRAVVRGCLGAAEGWVVMTCDYRHAALFYEADEFVRLGAWVKPNPMPQISGDRPGQGFESVLILHAGKRRKAWARGGGSGVWTVPTHGGGSEVPTQKPLALAQAFVADFTLPGEVVCDPFMGSGTTGVACVLQGRRFVGIEADPVHFDVCRRRIEEAYRQPRLFEEPPPRPVQDKLFGDAA
jgi:site-specific DNA-methyltransferase (adenine-specific)